MVSVQSGVSNKRLIKLNAPDGEGARWSIGYVGPDSECDRPSFRKYHFKCRHCPFLDCGSKFFRPGRQPVGHVKT